MTAPAVTTTEPPEGKPAVHPVDQVPPTPRLLILGLQHLFIMYAGAVAVPLIVGPAVGLGPKDIALLVSADLLVSGTGRSFARSGEYTRLVTVHDDQELGRSVTGGIGDLTVLNTTGSQFWGFPRDEYTTLEDAYDRMLATVISARWRFRSADAGTDWAAAFSTARSAMIDAFATTDSFSLQQTLYAMGAAVLAAVPELCEVRLALPNKHHFIVDLAPFGLDNENEVYYAADRPYGLIEGTVLADDAADAGIAWS